MLSLPQHSTWLLRLQQRRRLLVALPTIRQHHVLPWGSRPCSASPLWTAQAASTTTRRIPSSQPFQQQRRNYYYFPTTWEELSERFVRWMERTEARLMVVHVKLVRRRQWLLQQQPSKRPQQQLQQQQQQQPTTPSTPPTTTTIRQVSRRQISKFMGRTHARWNSFFYQKYHGSLTTPATTTTTLDSDSVIVPTTTLTASDEQEQFAPPHVLAANNHNCNYYDPSLSVPPPPPRPSLRSRYLGWKSRRREQYDRYRRSATAAMTRSSPSSLSPSSSKSSSSHYYWKMKPVLVKEYSKPEWFDPLVGRPLTSLDSIGRYVNPWQSQSTNGLHSPLTVLQWRWERFQQAWWLRQGRASRGIGSHHHRRHRRAVTSPMDTPYSSTTTTAKHDTQDNEEEERLLLSLQQPPQRVVNPLSPLPIPRLLRTHSHDSTTTTTSASDMMMDAPSSWTTTSATCTSSSSSTTTSSSSSSNMAVTWIGHSTCYLQMDGYSILFDPIFSHKSSPFQQDYIPIGEARVVPPSHTIAHLVDHCGGSIDFCCITHDHYDHMDRDSVRELAPWVHWWVVPLDMGPWLIEKGGVDPANIIELKWWQSARFLKNPDDPMGRPLRLMNRDDAAISTTTSTTSTTASMEDRNEPQANDDENPDNNVFTISCCPASHWGSRTMFDRNKRLWGSFALTAPHHRFFFCGDTGLPETFPLFRQIGDAYGPFDLACIPIGAYEPAHYNKDAHINPEEAVRVHQDLMSRHSIGIHWGTFALGDEPFEEPPLRLKEAMAQANEAAAASNAANSATRIGEVIPVAPFETILQGRTVIVSH